MTDQPSITLRLDALKLVFDVRPAIYVRCHEQKLDVYVNTETILDGDTDDMTTVRIRWGSGTPEEATWSQSTDHSAAFAPDPWAFLKQLLAVPDLRFEFRPFDAAPRVASFARGLDLHMAKLKAACRPPSDSSVHDSATGKVAPEMGMAAGDDAVWSMEAVDEKPERLSSPLPAYPLLLKQAGIEGVVMVQAVIDTMGRVEPGSLTITQTANPGFNESAKQTVLKSLFRPSRVHGKAVRVMIQVPVTYTIRR
jgi:TonB family protein